MNRVLASRIIAEKVQTLLRERTGWLFGNSASRLPPPLQDLTLGADLRARLHQAQLRLRAKQSRQRVHRATHNQGKNGSLKDLQAHRTGGQIKSGSRRRVISLRIRVILHYKGHLFALRAKQRSLAGTGQRSG